MIPAAKTHPPESPQETAGDPRGVASRKARMPAKNAAGPLRDLAELIATHLADHFEAESLAAAAHNGHGRD